mmetsp:Transcript_10928/g.33710  ORF Transcript_10928/g.33710 Transcript_10928/m.33710 type:complete len:205 (-) Transcript_10928:27-641(-)
MRPHDISVDLRLSLLKEILAWRSQRHALCSVSGQVLSAWRVQKPWARRLNCRLQLCQPGRIGGLCGGRPDGRGLSGLKRHRRIKGEREDFFRFRLLRRLCFRWLLPREKVLAWRGRPLRLGCGLRLVSRRWRLDGGRRGGRMSRRHGCGLSHPRILARGSGRAGRSRRRGVMWKRLLPWGRCRRGLVRRQGLAEGDARDEGGPG